MSKDIPEIDDLTRGINDSELILTEDTADLFIKNTTITMKVSMVQS